MKLHRNIMQIVLVLTLKCWSSHKSVGLSSPSSTFPAAGRWALTPLLAFTGTDSVTTTSFVLLPTPTRLISN